jgi:hypothetical protein
MSRKSAKERKRSERSVSDGREKKPETQSFEGNVSRIHDINRRR